MKTMHLLFISAVSAMTHVVMAADGEKQVTKTEGSWSDSGGVREVHVSSALVKLKPSEVLEVKKKVNSSITVYSGDIYIIEKAGPFDKDETELIKSHLPTKSEIDTARKNFSKAFQAVHK